MSTDEYPKQFEKRTEVLPFSRHGLSTASEFHEAEKDLQNLEHLRRIGLTDDEINIYHDHKAGRLNRQKVETSVLRDQLKDILSKINSTTSAPGSSKQSEVPDNEVDNIFQSLKNKVPNIYPEGHPMNHLKEIEESMFGHLKNNDILPINKRRKILRRLERRKNRALMQDTIYLGTINHEGKPNRPGSLWDMKEMPKQTTKPKGDNIEQMIGPKRPTMYTLKDNKIVRLEPVQGDHNDVYEAVDIVVPANQAESQLLEGTKMSVDNIKKIERFKDYEPGTPSKVLYLKNIATSVSQEQLKILFNQFVLENGGPIDVRLMNGRMRGQAFVAFNNEDLAIRALDEVNGTIMSGKPVIAQFGRNSNRIQMEENR